MAEFMHRYLPESRILIPKPTWSNHHKCVSVMILIVLTSTLILSMTMRIIEGALILHKAYLHTQNL